MNVVQDMSTKKPKTFKGKAISRLVAEKRSSRRRTQTTKNVQKRAALIDLKRKTRRISSIPQAQVEALVPYSPLSEPLPAAQPVSKEKVAEIFQWIAKKNERAPIASVRIGVVIFGHGGLVTEHVHFFNVPQHVNKTFQLPRGVAQTNVLGLRYAGLNNIGNRAYEESIDRYLTHRRDDMSKFVRYLDNYYQGALNELIRDPNGILIHPFQNEINKNQRLEDNLYKKKRIVLKGNHFGVREKYDTKRVQKFYTGRIPQYTDPTTRQIVPEEHPDGRHRELTTNGPLVKIFSIEINGKKRLPNGYYILIEPVPTGITLTQLIEQSILTVLPPQVIAAKKTIVDVIDLTCNTTELSNPTIEFIGAP